VLIVMRSGGWMTTEATAATDAERA
jgi:hypothetical protein